jgi:SAM-dependent methyltransferase
MIAFDAGWFTTKESAQEFSKKVERKAFEKGRRNRRNSLDIIDDEQIIEAFKRDFASLEDAKKDPLKLSEKSIKEEAKPRGGHWYYPARRIFGGKKSYYHALAIIMLKATWFSTLQEAELFTKEIINASKAEGWEKVSRAKRKMSEEEVLAAFLKEFPSLEEARKDLSRLSYHVMRAKAKTTKMHWSEVARSIFKNPKGKPGTWYKEILPNLVLRAGWFDSMDKAIEFANQVRAVSRKNASKRSAKALLKMTEEEVVGAFNKMFVSLDEAKKDLIQLGSQRVYKRIKSSPVNWWSSASTHFKQSNGKLGRWYDEVLPNLALKAGWFDTFEEAKDFAGDVKQFCKKQWRENLSLSQKRSIEATDIINAFKIDFPSLEEARTDLENLGYTANCLLASGNLDHWFHSAKLLYKESEDQKAGRWYDEVLPNLVLGAGWFETFPEALKFSKEVLDFCFTVRRKKISAKRLQMTKAEMIEAFTKDCPSLEKARKDLSRLGAGAIQEAAKKRKGHWFYPARVIFKPENAQRGNWYGDILPNLVLAAGWFLDPKDAFEFSEDVRRETKKMARSRMSAAQKKIVEKRSRKYAIIVRRLKQEMQGEASFDGISKFLTMDSIASDQNNQNGIARAVITSPHLTSSLTPAELLRFKMSTGKWSGDIAEAYANAFPFIAPYLTTRLLMLHVFRLFKEGEIQNLSCGASFMSGPGEVYHALEDIKDGLEKDIDLPFVIDIDAEPDMLDKSGNPKKLLASLPKSGLASESLDFVECSSLYQFNSRMHPTIVKDTLLEAKRILKEGGALILTGTAKLFCAKFEEALKSLGFDIITPANTRLKISEDTQNRIEEQMGTEVLRKANEAANDTYFLVAVKTDRSSEDVSAKLFGFEKQKTKLPEEAKNIAKQARSFTRSLDDSKAAENIERMANALENFSPDTHLNHALLIQSVLSKYMLDKRIKKPKEDENSLLENAEKIVNIAENALSTSETKDRYFLALKRMAKIHASRLKASKSVQPKNKRT